MKSAFKYLSVILVIVLVLAIIFLGAVVYYNFIEVRTFDSTYNETNSGEAIVEGDKNEEELGTFDKWRKKINLAIQKVLNKEEETEFEIAVLNENYFYNQLSDSQKKLYSGLQNNKDNLMYGNYKVEFGNIFSDVLNQENGGKILGDDYQATIEAFTHDNPDLFFLDVNKMYINIESTKRLTGTTYSVYISADENGNYYSEGFTSYDQVVVAKKQIEEKRDSFVNTLKGTTYQKIKMIHDYLVDNIEYDSEYESAGRYTLYGALIDKKCVCEGYAKAFKYLANAAGINCEILQGEATNSYGTTESHAWNCVEVANAWYQLDATWDDPVIVGKGVVFNKTKYKYFLKGTATFDRDHKISRQFTDEGKIFNYPELSRSDYD